MSDDGPGAREVAYRPFAAEFDDASLSYSESDEERAPNYVVTPTGARVNRLFAVGVLTEVERINDDTRRGRIVDPSGAFVTYAGQYQPEAQTFLERATTPSFVALTGKARTFEPEDSDRVFTSVRPESINEVDADTRDRWVVAAAESTLDRLAVFRLAQRSELRGEELRRALDAGGAPASLSAGVPRAIDHYGTTPAYVEAVRRLAVDALELVAGDRDEVRRPEIAPDEGGDATVGSLPETDVSIDASTVGSEPDAIEGDGESEESIESGGDTGVAAEPDPDVAAEPDPDVAAEPDPDVADAVAGSGATLGEDPSVSTDDHDGEPGRIESADEDGFGAIDDEPGEAEVGDFDDGESDAEPAVSDEMYELDDEEREEIESEYGTEFATGTEVDDAGEADIDVPDPDEPIADDVDEQAAEADTDATADVDLEAVVVGTMDDLDDGDGADREAVIDDVVSTYGVTADDVEDAIEDALMGGKCYEPSDGVLKAI